MNATFLEQFSKNLKDAGFNVSDGWWVEDTVMITIERNEKIDRLYNADAEEQDNKPFYDLMPKGLQEIIDNGSWLMSWGAINFKSTKTNESHILGYGLSLKQVH